MKFKGLPGITAAWPEFLQSGLPAYEVPVSVRDLALRASALQGRTADGELIRLLTSRDAGELPLSESIGRLGRPDAVVILAKIYSGFLGGPIAQILKCLTAIKLSAQLRACSVNAVPVAWVDSGVCNFPVWEIALVDDAEIRSFGVAPGAVIPGTISETLSIIENFGRDAYDGEVLDVIRRSFAAGRSFSSATAELFSSLLQQWGMILIDSAGIRRSPSELLPVLSWVLSPFEVDPVSPRVSTTASAPITAWPQASATIGDVRVHRTMDRYGLELKQLFEGEAAVLGVIRNSLPRGSLDKLSGLKHEVETGIGSLTALAEDESGFSKLARSTQEKILYQLNKLQTHFDAALKAKEDVAARRIRNACALLAPGGRLQEMAIGAVQIPLRYSTRGLNVLYEHIDVTRFEHQLIWMD